MDLRRLPKEIVRCAVNAEQNAPEQPGSSDATIEGGYQFFLRPI